MLLSLTSRNASSSVLYKEVVYFNREKPPVEFWVPTNSACLIVLISKLNDLLHDTYNRKVRKVEFYEDWIDTNGRVKYNLIKLKIDEDFKVIRKS